MTKPYIPTPEVLAEAARQRRKHQHEQQSDGSDNPLSEPVKPQEQPPADSRA
jgi:hypothetical protein